MITVDEAAAKARTLKRHREEERKMLDRALDEACLYPGIDAPERFMPFPELPDE